MLKRFIFCLALTCAVAPATLAQNANSSTATRARTATAAQANANGAAAPQEEATPTPRASGRRKGAGQDDPSSKDVLEAFNALTEGIKAANAAAVNGGYWSSTQLVIYNNNGTVTRGWEQMRSNRESLYAKVKDVTLDVRDVHVQMLGRDGAVVAFLWTQSQTFDGTPGTATGRTTLVFRRIGKQWKVVHAHISPDAPDQSRVPQAERTTTTPTPKPTP